MVEVRNDVRPDEEEKVDCAESERSERVEGEDLYYYFKKMREIINI